MANETYYADLEVSENASTAEIRAARNRLLKDVHPDRVENTNDYWKHQAEEKTKEINEAFEVLSNPEKRRLYDAELRKYRSASATAAAHPNVGFSGPHPASQQSHPSSGTQSDSSANNKSAQSSQPTSQPTASVPAPSSGSQSANRSAVTALDPLQRFSFAYFCFVVSVGVGVAFLDSSSLGADLFLFLLAIVPLCGLAYLYRHRLRRLFNAMGMTRPKHQAWATVCIIGFALLIGKAGVRPTRNSPPEIQRNSSKAKPNGSHAKAEPRQTELQPNGNTPVPSQNPKNSDEVSEVHFTPEQLKDYYAVYSAPDVRYLRTLFDAYLSDASGRDQEWRRNREFDLLANWNRDYYRSKFIVYSRDRGVMGGMTIYLIFQDKPDHVFWAWVYGNAAEQTMELRAFEPSKKITEEGMSKIRILLRSILEDRQHAM